MSTTQQKTVHRMYWRSKKNPHNEGEGEIIRSEKKAQETCAWHNHWHRGYHHWYEAEQVDE